MKICNRCGSTCDDCEMIDCHCGGHLEEAQKCEICGEYFNAEDLTFGICDNCLKSEANLFNAIELGNDNKETILINGFFASLGTKIVEALISQAIRKDYILDMLAIKASEYCLEDKECFADFLSQEVIDEKNREQRGLSFGSCNQQIEAV